MNFTTLPQATCGRPMGNAIMPICARPLSNTFPASDSPTDSSLSRNIYTSHPREETRLGRGWGAGGSGWKWAERQSYELNGSQATSLPSSRPLCLSRCPAPAKSAAPCLCLPGYQQGGSPHLL